MLPLLPCCPWRNVSPELVLRYLYPLETNQNEHPASESWNALVQILLYTFALKRRFWKSWVIPLETWSGFHDISADASGVLTISLLISKGSCYSQHIICAPQSASVLCHQFSHKPRLGPKPSTASIFHVTEQRVFWEMGRSYGGDIGIWYFAVNNKEMRIPLASFQNVIIYK